MCGGLEHVTCGRKPATRDSGRLEDVLRRLLGALGRELELIDLRPTQFEGGRLQIVHYLQCGQGRGDQRSQSSRQRARATIAGVRAYLPGT